jgi:hypothetical protein
MKRILLLPLAVLVASAQVYAGGLKVDLSRYDSYKSYNIKGLIIVLHKSIYNDKVKTQQCLNYWSNSFSNIEKLCPSTATHFKKNKYRLYLYSLPSTRGGMEFIRDGQYLWDKRMSAYVNRGIIVPRALFYIRQNQKENGAVYLLHEIAHYRHVVMIGENGRGYDKVIRTEYNKAMRNPLYRGTYASKNHLEYFAEISMAYLLRKHTVAVFPSGSRELYEKDRIGYDLCKKIWGENLASYRPQRQRLVANPPVQSISPFGMSPEPALDLPPSGRHRTYEVTQGQRTGSLQDRLTTYATEVFRNPSDEEVLISKKFLEMKMSISKAETEEMSGNHAMSHWLYGNSLRTLNDFKKENPQWSASVIDGMINRVKSKIN